MLIAARFLQGAAGAVASAVILGMVVGLFPDGRERARAIGIYSFIGAAGAAIGLLAGGVLTQTLGWHWVFLVNVPIGDADRADGTAGATGGSSGHGGTRPRRPGGAADHHRAHADRLHDHRITGPGLDLAGHDRHRRCSVRCCWPPSSSGSTSRGIRCCRCDSCGDRPVWVANLVQFLMVGALFAFQFMLGVYLQVVLGFGPAATGLAFLPITAVIGLFSLLITPRLLLRWGGERCCWPA